MVWREEKLLLVGHTQWNGSPLYLNKRKKKQPNAKPTACAGVEWSI